MSSVQNSGSAPIQNQDVSQAKAAQGNLEIAGINLSQIMMILAQAQYEAKDLGNTIKEKKNNEPKCPPNANDDQRAAHQSEHKVWENEVAGLQNNLQGLFDKIAVIEGQMAVAQHTVDHIRNVEIPKASETDKERLEQEAARLSALVGVGKANISALTDGLQEDGGNLLRSVTQKTDMEIDVDVNVKLSGGRTANFKVDGDFQLSVKRLSIALDQVGGVSGAARGAAAQSSGLLTGAAQGSSGVYKAGSPAEAAALNTLRTGVAQGVRSTDLNDPKQVNALSSSLTAKFAAIASDANLKGGNIDVTALVQYVLMQAYQDSTQDMYVFAKKVQHFNSVKQALRAELTRAKDFLSKNILPKVSDTEESKLLRTSFQKTNMPAGNYATFGTEIDPNNKNTGKTKDEFKAGAPTNVKKDVEDYIARLDEKLATVGDDAQTANLELQQFVQKQQQVLQLMSNLYKMFHETAMSIVRKIGG